MNQYIDHLHEEEIIAVVKATLREESTHELMGLLGLPVDGVPVSFADRLDIQVRALQLDGVVEQRKAHAEQERRRVRIIESDIHFASRKARKLVSDLLDQLDADIPAWVAEFRLEDASHAISDFNDGGAVGDLVLDESLHLQGVWETALHALLTAVQATAADENADYAGEDDTERVA